MTDPLMSRRTAVRAAATGAAIVAGGAALTWVAPSVHAVSMAAANAASAPPERVRGPEPRGPGNNRGSAPR